MFQTSVKILKLLTLKTVKLKPREKYGLRDFLHKSDLKLLPLKLKLTLRNTDKMPLKLEPKLLPLLLRHALLKLMLRLPLTKLPLLMPKI